MWRRGEISFYGQHDYGRDLNMKGVVGCELSERESNLPFVSVGVFAVGILCWIFSSSLKQTRSRCGREE